MKLTWEKYGEVGRWHVAARVGKKVGNEWSRGGGCRGKRSGYYLGEQLFLARVDY